MHEIGRIAQIRTELAAGVENLEIRRRKATRFEQRNGEAVAQCKLHGRGGRWRQPMRTGFLGDGKLQHNVGRLAESAITTRSNGDHGYCETAGIAEHIAELDCFPRPRQGDDRIITRNHAEITMTGFTRMNEEGRRSSRGECRSKLLANMATLAEPCHDDASGVLLNEFDRFGQMRAKLTGQCGFDRAQAFNFEIDRPQGRKSCGLSFAALLFAFCRKRFGRAVLKHEYLPRQGENIQEPALIVEQFLQLLRIARSQLLML